MLRGIWGTPFHLPTACLIPLPSQIPISRQEAPSSSQTLPVGSCGCRQHGCLLMVTTSPWVNQGFGFQNSVLIEA